jgi:hypothetical protein
MILRFGTVQAGYRVFRFLAFLKQQCNWTEGPF